jgi:DNA-binding transcriptional MerR regulator
MKKAQDAFRTISEVSEVLETPAHVLRFWESKFYQIKPVKRAGGRRYYRPDDMALLSGIRHLLQDQGLTIRGVQRMLQEQGPRHVATLGAPLVNLSALDTPRLVEGADEDSVPATNADGDAYTSAQTGPAANAAPADTGDHPAAPMHATPDPIDRADTPAKLPERATKVAANDPADLAPPARSARAQDAIAAPPADVPALSPNEARNRIAHTLRSLPRGALGTDAGRVELLARRIDKLLERMSEASGAGRW